MAAIQKPPTVSDDARAQDIYRRAAEIIHRKGFDATSMGDIAEAVDLTKGGLYYYIKGKRALLFAIMNFAMDLVEERVLEPARRIDDPDRRLAQLISAHVNLVIDEAHAMTILVYEDEGLDPEHRQRILERKEVYADFLRDAIAAVLVAHEQEGSVDPTVAAFSLMGMAHWVVRWYRSDGALSKDAVVEQITRLALHGLAPDDGVGENAPLVRAVS